jgi:hypothetical protein
MQRTRQELKERREIKNTIATLHEKARQAIESGVKAFDSHAREAAEYLAKARDLGATQWESGEAVGKSAAWVNALLKWRDKGYQTPVPFPRSHRYVYVSHLADSIQAAEWSKSRDLLIKALGMLGSEHAGERAAAALKVEEQLKRLGLTWEQLIVRAVRHNQKAEAIAERAAA